MRLRLKRLVRPRTVQGLSGLAVGAVVAVVAIGGAGYALFLGGFNGGSLTSGINLQKGLVGWWKLDGNANDSSPYRDAGTVNGTVTAAADRENSSSAAMSFDGASGYIDVPDSSQLNPGSALTISAWIKASSFANSAGVISKDNGGGIQNPPYDFQATGSGIQFLTTSSANSAKSVSSDTLSTGVWYFLTGTFDGTTMRFYVNGSLVGSVAQTDIGSTTGTLKIGQQKAGYGRFFSGSIDDARVYNRAISTAEVTALYQQYSSQLSADSGQQGLLGQWKLDGNGNDSSPYRENGTLSGATPAVDRKGAAGGALSFSGSNSYVKIAPGNTYKPTAALTASIWANPTNAASSAQQKLMSTTEGGGWALLINGSTSDSGCSPHMLCFALRVGSYSGYYQAQVAATVLPSNAWSLVTATFDGTDMKLYVNGSLVATATHAGAITNSGSALCLGAETSGNSCPTNYFAGSLDDARVYGRALSAQEIVAMYNSYNSQINLNSSPTNQGTLNLNNGLIGYWNFNGNSNDSTPYRDNGTVSGATLTADRRGRVSAAYAFVSGSSANNITMPLAYSAAYGGLTLSAWVYPTAYPSGDYATVIKGNNPNSYYLSVSPTGQVSTYWYARSPEGYFFTPAGSVSLNRWTLLTVSWNDSGVSLYVDGALKATATSSGSGKIPTGITVGAESVARQFQGSIDDVRIYNRALSGAEVTALYNNYY